MYGYPRTPYDPACGGWKPVIGMGNCHGQHQKHAAIHVPRFTNVTTVDDYHLDADGDPIGDPIPPYSRPDSSDCDDCYRAGCALPNDKVLCGTWPIDERPSSAGAGQVLLDYNVYQRLAEETIDLSLCRKIGFKNVQGRKVWHGIFGFMSVDRDVWGPFCDETDSGNCGCDYRGYQPNPDQTKYLKAHGVASYITNGSLDTPLSSTTDRTAEVGRFDGNTTRTGEAEGDDDGAAADALLGIQADHPGTLVGLYCAKVAANENVDMVFTQDGDFAWTVTWTHVFGGGDETTGEISVDLFGGTYSCDITTRAAGPSTPITKTEEATLTLTNTTAVWYQRIELTPGVGNSLNTQNCTITLSVPYTASDLSDDLYGHLSEWNLADDLVYPWRQDAALESGPIVFRDEADLPTTPVLSGAPSDSVFSGDILGAPLPAGYGPHFDFDRRNEATPDTFGKLNPGPAPTTATKWTPDVTAQPLGPGAWWRHSIGGVAWAQKWAEILVRRPRYNFFGPWGRQRYSLDEQRTGCVTAEAGSPVVVTVDFFGADPTGSDEIVTGTLCYRGGKVWEVTRNTDTEYELTTEVADVPALAQPDGDVFGPLRFPDAWPIGGRVEVLTATQAGPLVDITVGGGRAGDASWLRDDDQVDFTGVDGLGAGLAVTVIAANHFTVTGTLGSVYAGGGTARSTGTASDRYKWFDTQPHGDFVTNTWEHDFRDTAIADYLCLRHNGAFCVCAADDFELVTCPDDGTESDIRRWQVSHGMARSVKSFTSTQRCLGYTPCEPQVVCFSPNYDPDDPDTIDKFKGSATTIGFGAYSADDTYGAAWQAAVEQNMPYPDEQNRDTYLWEPPHKSCEAFSDESGYEFDWNEDNGECAADVPPAYYFPQRAWFERRLTKPTGAPDLPTDVKLGFASLADLDTETLPDGTLPVASAPVLHETVGGVPLEYDAAPWVVALRQEACVCAPGRFSDEYEENAIQCVE